jgi:hypothetical protein
MDTGVTTDYLEALKEEADLHGNFILEGKCSSYDMYKYKVGLMQGLQKAELTLHDILQEASKYQDQD